MWAYRQVEREVPVSEDVEVVVYALFKLPAIDKEELVFFPGEPLLAFVVGDSASP